jgi:hypothetical protein
MICMVIMGILGPIMGRLFINANVAVSKLQTTQSTAAVTLAQLNAAIAAAKISCVCGAAPVASPTPSPSPTPVAPNDPCNH